MDFTLFSLGVGFEENQTKRQFQEREKEKNKKKQKNQLFSLFFSSILFSSHL